MNLLYMAYGFAGLVFVFGVAGIVLLVKILKKPLTVEQKSDVGLVKINNMIDNLGTSLTKITTTHLDELEKQLVVFNQKARTKKYPKLKKIQDDFEVIEIDKIEYSRGRHFDIYVLEDKGTGKQFLGTSHGGLTER